MRYSQEPNGPSFSHKKTSICRAEFHEQPHEQRAGRHYDYTPRVMAALRWLVGTYGDSPGDVKEEFGELRDQQRNRFFADYSRAAKHFHEMGSRPLFTTYVGDWTGDGSRDQKRELKSYHTPWETTPAHCLKLSGNRRKVRTGHISTHANYASKRDAECMFYTELNEKTTASNTLKATRRNTAPPPTKLPVSNSRGKSGH